MPEQWLTYRQLGEIWNTTPEAARARSRRGKFQRRTSEQGTAEVLVDPDAFAPAAPRNPSAGDGWVAMPPFYGEEQAAADELTLKSLQELETQVAALSRELSKSEEQVETMRRHLAAEREQVAHLMTVLLRSEKTKRGFLSRLMFWRKHHPPAGHKPVQAHPHSPDRLRQTPHASPDSAAILPDSPPDRVDGQS